MSRRFRKSHFRKNNVVPGHVRYEKRGKGHAPEPVMNPGYSVHPGHFQTYKTPWFKHRYSVAEPWYKPFKSKPVKRREKRGQGKPR